MTDLFAQYEAEKKAGGGEVTAEDMMKSSNTNPEIDNLYLDMNGIIHPCCHPQGKP